MKLENMAERGEDTKEKSICRHNYPALVEAVEDGVRARCLNPECGAVGPVRGTSKEAWRALLGLEP